VNSNGHKQPTKGLLQKLLQAIWCRNKDKLQAEELGKVTPVK